MWTRLYAVILFLYVLMSADKAYAYWYAFSTDTAELNALPYFTIMPIVMFMEVKHCIYKK